VLQVQVISIVRDALRRGGFYARYLAFAVAVCFLAARSFAAEVDDHQAFHRAVELWVGNEEDESLRVIEAAVAKNDGSEDPESRATLYDLGARILQHQANNGSDAAKKREMINRAEYFAARAAHQYPESFDFWRDYMRLAEELRGEQGVRSKLRAAWRYSGDYPEFFSMTSEDHRLIARAALDTLHGRDGRAVAALETYADRASQPSCETLIILANLEFQLDRVEAARDTLTKADRCRDHPLAALLAVRIETETSNTQGQVDADEMQRDTTSHADPLPLFRDRLVVRDKVDEHRADIENIVLQDTTRLAGWCDLWRILAFNPKSEREFDDVLRLADRVNTTWETSVVRLYSELGHGRFENAESQARALLALHPGDPHIEAALILAMAWLGSGRSASHDPVERLWASDPYLTRCLDRQQLDYCLTRNRLCVYGAIVCNEPHDFVLEAFDHGLAKRSGEIKRQVNWVVGNETIARINGEQRLHSEMLARDDVQRERLDALRLRIELSIAPAVLQAQQSIADLRGKLTEAEADQQELARALDRARRDLERARQESQKAIERLARDITVQISATNDRLATTQLDLAHLSLRFAADRAALNPIDVDGLMPTVTRYAALNPDEMQEIMQNVMAQVNAAMRSNKDSVPLFKDVVKDCKNFAREPVPCYRSVLAATKRYVDVQAPIVPSILSIDVLGVADTVVEILGKIIDMVGPSKSLDLPLVRRR